MPRQIDVGVPGDLPPFTRIKVVAYRTIIRAPDLPLNL